MKGDHRRWAGRTHAVVASLLLAAIIVEVNYISFRNYDKWDWTSQGFYTLSDRAIAELNALRRPVDFYLFLPKGDPSHDQIEELLDRCQAETDRLTVHYVDPDRDPSRYELLVSRFELRTSLQSLMDTAAVVEVGDQHWTITRNDLVGFGDAAFENPDDPKMDVRAEQAIIGALVRATTGDPTRICLSSGHGEWSLDASAELTVSPLREELRRENVEMVDVGLLRSRAAFDDCDAVYILGPDRPLSADEADELAAYLRRGGNALITLDPILDEERVSPTGLEEALASFGVLVDRTVVLETNPQLLLPPGNAAGPFGVVAYGQHETTLMLRRAESVMWLGRSIRAAPDGGATELMFASEMAWGESDLTGHVEGLLPEQDAEDVPGPVPLAVAVELPERLGADSEDAADGEDDPDRDDQVRDTERGGRLVVVGDTDWLRSDWLRDPRQANGDLATLFTGWLTDRETLLSIRPKEIALEPMRIYEEDLDDLLFRVLVLIPAAMLLLGFAMWWTRRS